MLVYQRVFCWNMGCVSMPGGLAWLKSRVQEWYCMVWHGMAWYGCVGKPSQMKPD